MQAKSVNRDWGHDYCVDNIALVLQTDFLGI